MADVPAVDKLLQWLGEVLDRVLALLTKVGVDLPAIFLQVFLLLLAGAAVYGAARGLKARSQVKRAGAVMAVVALMLVALGIVITVIDNLTMPDRVAGRIRFERLEDVSVALLDFRDRVVSSGSGAVDTVTGAFVLHYGPFVNGRARKLRVVATGCRSADFELSRPQLRAASEQEQVYSCVPS